MTGRQLDEERILHVARDIPNVNTRAEYLDQVCAGNQALRDRVEALLEVYEREQECLEPAPTVDSSPFTERPGSTIGRYRLMERIGEGGMGIVFVAEQQRPLQRKVALKVIKPGMDSRAVIARFEAERQALALMDHPHIARVFDAGTTDSGHPYFVMELVRGIPITDYCDQNKMPVRDRLELFIPVCQAIQHAHQKGIIHRDIKPGNVLVTLHDGKPVPKVIDFGLAKALHQRLTERTVYTAFAQVMGTPLYMSPEQAELSGLDIDTRSDVYSLGVLLYELLTGSTPLQHQRIEQAGYDEIRRLIRENEPPMPSTKISSLGATATTVSENRRTDPARLAQLVRGDLDCIVMKALEKDRTRRFETASNLAADVRRYLDDEPITARPPSAMYRLIKFSRRHRLRLTAAAAAIVILSISFWDAPWTAAFLLILALSSGSLIAGLAWRQARREARRAQEASAILTAKHSQLERTLAQLHSQLIETALLQSLQGRSDEFDACLRRAEAAGVPRAWLYTLEGTAYLHSAEPFPGRQCLQQALEADPANVAAQAMLGVLHIWNGDWNEWSLLVERMRTVSPREHYHDFDLLCLAYAKFYEDHLQAARQLEAILERHPTWIVPRALLAAAWGHAAAVHENIEFARRALYEVAVPERLAGENPFVLVCAACVYVPAVVVLGKDAGDADRQARVCARRLARYPENHILTNLRALYYQVVGDAEEERNAWNDTLKHGRGFAIEEALAARFRWNMTDDLPDLSNRGLEPEIGLAYIDAYRGRHDRAYAVYQKMNRSYRTWYVRYKLTQLLLLLRREQEARDACREWLADSVGIEHFGDWEKRGIEFIAGKRPAAEFTAADDDPVGTFFVHYQQAFLAYARGNIGEARERFLRSAQWKYPDERRHWARAFAIRLAEDRAAADQEANR